VTGTERLIWRVAVPALRTLTRIVLRPAVTGSAQIGSGGAVLAYNHERLTDWLLAIQVTGRPIRFLVGDNIMRWPVVGRLLRASGQIAVVRGAGDSDAIRRAVQWAAAGGLVGVFPEGRLVRGDGLGAIQRGAALIATRADVPLVPIAIGRRPATVRVGTPLPPDGSTRALTGRLEGALARLATTRSPARSRPRRRA
jgi:1-acyl-sn-glycerol-3-phosphate acyltransferase